MEIRGGRECLMREVVVEKYGSSEWGWRTRAITVSVGCGLWRSIMKGGNTSMVTLPLGKETERRLGFGIPTGVGITCWGWLSQIYIDFQTRRGQQPFRSAGSIKRKFLETSHLGEIFITGRWNSLKGFWSYSTNKSGIILVIHGGGPWVSMICSMSNLYIRACSL